MDKRFFLQIQILLFLSIFLAGSFFRFYKLDWAEGLFPHPDEYHIVGSVEQLSFPEQMHPHFFSYGTAVIYPIYFTKITLEKFGLYSNSFFIGRLYSAFFSSLTILLVYAIVRSILPWRWAIVAMVLVTLTPGLIQQAHFATPESELTFFLLGTLFFLLTFTKEKKQRYLLLASIFLGCGMGVKITAVLLLPVIITTILIRYFFRQKKLIGLTILSLTIVFLTFFIIDPYVFLDYKGWQGTMYYEGLVAMGALIVFYTRQFINTIPVIFQMQKIFPFTLGPVMEIVGLLGLLVMVGSFVRKPSFPVFLIIFSFFSFFIPHAFLFAKWTRFMIPIVPFFAIFAAYYLYVLSKKRKIFSYSLTMVLCIATALWALAFFTIYTRQDVRITVGEWLENNTKPDLAFLVEGGNTVDLPLKGNFRRISLDFYTLEEDNVVRQKIIDALQESEYFLVQSRRVFMNHQRLPELYPKTSQFYGALFAGKLGFEKIKELHSYPQLGVGNWMLVIADEDAEETWSVFDHPVIRIFKKTRQLEREEYAKVLED